MLLLGLVGGLVFAGVLVALVLRSGRGRDRHYPGSTADGGGWFAGSSGGSDGGGWIDGGWGGDCGSGDGGGGGAGGC